MNPTHHHGDPMATLRSCHGYYECPKDQDGKRLGPLIGYAGTYAPSHHYVGETYLNVAAIETYPRILRGMTAELIDGLPPCDWVMGIPEGGRTMAAFIAAQMNTRFIYPEKEILRIGTDSQRGESRFVMKRHVIPPRSRGVLIEDVTNNFSSTEEMIDLVGHYGAEVVAIGCLFNRSSYDGFYKSGSGRPYPIISLGNIPLVQYRQDDPAVRDDVAGGNVIWNPKSEWPNLMTIMENAERRTHGIETGS